MNDVKPGELSEPKLETAYGHLYLVNLWLLQSPHCQIQETTNSQAHTCVYLYPSWAHSLVHTRTVGSILG